MKMVEFTKLGSNGLSAGKVFVNASTVFSVSEYDSGYGIGSKIESTTGQTVNVNEYVGTVSRKISSLSLSEGDIDRLSLACMCALRSAKGLTATGFDSWLSNGKGFATAIKDELSKKLT